LLLVSACHDNTNNTSKDMSMIVDHDGGGDAAVCSEAAACALGGGAKGLCKSGTCAACTDTTDDLACDTAYSEPNKHFICSSGCVEGCRTSADCGGKLCGVTTPNVCGSCATDTQCVMDNGAGFICETASGKCVASTCSNTGSACTANSADICCAGASGSACVAGSCCTNSDCGDAGKSCVNHVCTSCPSPAPNTLVVDPSETVGGDATGADVAGCRYKTISAAMQVAASGTTIKVLGTQLLTGDDTCTSLATTECLPIGILAGVQVVGDSTLVPTLRVPLSLNGFQLKNQSSVLSHFKLDGANAAGIHQGSYGIDAALGPTASPTPAPAIDHVELLHFGIGGIDVHGAGASLDIGPGVSAHDNGVGLKVEQSSVVHITGGADPISFSSNANQGITASTCTLKVSGTAGTLGAGSVVLNQNAGGIAISSGTVELTGVVAYDNSASGITVQGGSSLKMRSCYVLKNGGSGVDVSGAGSLAAINLGGGTGDTSSGHNTLQDATNPNTKVGICLAIAGTLFAQGNVFGTHDCSAAASMISKQVDCTTQGDIATTGGGVISTDQCTQ
jgi:hypothetical protein